MTRYVEAVHLFNTGLITKDNRTLTLFNNLLTDSPITNYSRLGTWRVDLSFIVGTTSSGTFGHSRRVGYLHVLAARP